MQSLRDKLLKAGVVSEEDAKRAAEAKAKEAERPRRDAGQPERSRARGDRPLVAPRSAQPERSRGPAPRREYESPLPKFDPIPGTAAASRELARKQLELDRKIRDLVASAEVPVEIGATVFYFMTRKNKLRRMTLTEAQAALLREGKLAVVERPEPAQIEHSLVPPEAAEAVLKLSERAVRFLNKPGAQVGFLSDEEIHRRAAEAEAPEAPPAETAPATSAEAPKGDGPMITIRRAPLAAAAPPAERPVGAGEGQGEGRS